MEQRHILNERSSRKFKIQETGLNKRGNIDRSILRSKTAFIHIYHICLGQKHQVIIFKKQN